MEFEIERPFICGKPPGQQVQYTYVPYVVPELPVIPGVIGIGFTVPLDLQKPEMGVVENSSGQLPTAITFPMEIAVDANRDGTITLSREGNFDQTSQVQPFRFWVNNGIDGNSTAPGEGSVQDSLEPGSQAPNCQPGQLGVITCARDLENLARLWIDMKGTLDTLNASYNTPTSHLQIGLKWENVTGTPAINLYTSADSAGSASYLTDPTAAQAQALESIALTDVNAKPTVDTSGTDRKSVV